MIEMPSARLLAAYADVTPAEAHGKRCGACEHWLGDREAIPRRLGLCEALDAFTGYHAGEQCKRYERMSK